MAGSGGSLPESFSEYFSSCFPRQIKECVDLSGQFLMRLVEGLGLFTQPPAGLIVFEPLFVQMEQFPNSGPARHTPQD